jgi:Bacterial SH3 domain
MSSDGLPACVVVDPTSTPLNIRTAPNGQIVGTIPNGQPVRILNQTKDTLGKPWASIADANSRPLGWVFREYLVCR